MENREEGLKAIQELDSKDLGGRALKVNEARPKSNSGGGAAAVAADDGTREAVAAHAGNTPVNVVCELLTGRGFASMRPRLCSITGDGNAKESILLA